MSKIFITNTLNIFCDASIKIVEDTYIGCPGAIAVITDMSAPYGSKIFDTEYLVLQHSTNNNSEIYALVLAVRLALKHRFLFNNINIFSDSKISVFGLREWIFNWVNNRMDGKMYSSSGTPVANQELFLRIVKLVVDHQLNVNINHQKAHVNISNNKSIEAAQKCFKTSNGVDISYEDALGISIYNDHIDVLTGVLLEKNIDEMINVSIQPIYYDPNKGHMNQYRKLIQRR